MGFPIRTLNGVGVVATSKRNIKSGFEYNGYFPKPDYSDPLLTPNGENEDTIDVFIPKIVKQYLSDTAKISEVLKQTTLEATCRSIFDFVYTHIQYHLDAPHEEQIRRPARTWADRKSGVDCDCYTVFISSILTNLNIPHRLRMTAYNHTRGYQHIYIVVPKRNNSNMSLKSDYFTIDPVLNVFNEEKPYLTKKDKVMTLSNGLSGFPIRNLNGAPAFKARSKYVYDDILLVPSANTWGLRGIDGGIYLEGNFARRYIEPLDGAGLGIWGTVLSTGLKIGKGIFKGIKGLFKGKKWRKAQRAKQEAEAKAQEQPASVTPITPVSSGFTPQRGNYGLTPQGGGLLSNNSPFSSQSGGLLAENPFKKDEFFAREDKQTNLLASLIDSRTKQSNNSIVRSLDLIDKNTKSQISKMANQLLSIAADSASEGKSMKEILSDVKKNALAVAIDTDKIKEQQRLDALNTIKVNENVLGFKKSSFASGNMQKYLMIGLIGGGALLLLSNLNKKQTQQQ